MASVMMWKLSSSHCGGAGHRAPPTRRCPGRRPISGGGPRAGSRLSRSMWSRRVSARAVCGITAADSLATSAVADSQAVRTEDFAPNWPVAEIAGMPGCMVSLCRGEAATKCSRGHCGEMQESGWRQAASANLRVLCGGERFFGARNDANGQWNRLHRCRRLTHNLSRPLSSI